jgi:hypothetical protein
MSITNYLGPAEIAAYSLRSQQANTGAARGLSKIANYQKYANMDYGQNRAQARRNFGLSYRSLPASFARRNVLRSGMRETARQNNAYDYQQAMARMKQAYDRQMGGFQEQTGDINLIQSMTLAQIEAEKAARQEELASRLMGLQQGGN